MPLRFNTLKTISFALLVLAGCAAVNAPINVPKTDGLNAPIVRIDAASLPQDDLFIGLAFSGGGMRASAFAHGMIEALQDIGKTPENPYGLLPHVRLVTGVSGGSVTAAHFGLNGPKGVAGYRERYLVTNAEKYMANKAYNPVTLARGLSGGANGRKTFGRYLDETLFHGASFGDLAQRSDILTWINAADVASETSFLFSPETFDALCSDLASLPVSEAVAASAAFPLVFSPIVLKAHSERCTYQEPDWLTAARYNPESTATMKAHGKVLENYADAEKVKYVKLLDGGITDNFGTVALAVARAKSQNQYGPLSEEQAVRVRNFLFLVANAGVEKDPAWANRQRGPGGVGLGRAIVQSAMNSATRTAYDAMRLTLEDWHADVVDYRCGLPAARVKALRGSLAGWDCRDVKMFVGVASFEELPEEMQAELNTIPTRLKLKVDQVDLAIEAGRMATRMNPEFNGLIHAAGFAAPVGAAQGGTQIKPVRITPVRN
ncbi:patatin-like phospholipase family protein [Pelagimonas varians]|uniref:Patatin-like phospholipase n=1 Tax=Pelagimonas varians TaxID=696760 RepID=A0A238L0I2_9RHOB|nr:patatin-like phospholipase family protein [Pelagimonas varians]PYG27179.1 NTE family protein [Pelagimonas varians]SMX48594.1 Patatin-like phospholipase [Pelagimonas varians]